MDCQALSCKSGSASSNDDTYEPTRQTFLILWMKAVPLVFLAFSTVVFNLLVLWMFKVKKSLRSCKNIYLASLALADLIVGLCMLVAIFQQLKHLVNWLPFVWCRIYLILRQVALYVSLLSLLLITIDRWWSIHYPFSYRTKRRKSNALMAVCFIWLFGFVLHILPLVLWDSVVNEDSGPNSTTPESNLEMTQFLGSCEVPFSNSFFFVITISAVQYFIPLTAMLTLNCSLYLGILGRKRIQIRRSVTSSDRLTMYEKRVSISSVPEFSSSPDESAELLLHRSGMRQNYMRLNAGRRFSVDAIPLKTSKSTPQFQIGNSGAFYPARRFSLALCRTSSRPSKGGEELAKDLLVKQDRRAACWLGLLVVVFMVCWLPHTIVGIMQSIQLSSVPKWARDVTFWFLLAHSAINPLLYGLFNKEIRGAFKQWLCGSNRHAKRVKNALLLYGISLNPALPGSSKGRRRFSSFATVPE